MLRVGLFSPASLCSFCLRVSLSFLPIASFAFLDYPPGDFSFLLTLLGETLRDSGRANATSSAQHSNFELCSYLCSVLCEFPAFSRFLPRPFCRGSASLSVPPLPRPLRQDLWDSVRADFLLSALQINLKFCPCSRFVLYVKCALNARAKLHTLPRFDAPIR